MYTITDSDLRDLSAAMIQYYDDAVTEGIKERLNEAAYANMGIVTAAGDRLQGLYADFRKKGSDSFKVTIEAKVRGAVAVYFANGPAVADDVLLAIRGKLEELAGQIPVVGPVAQKIAAAGIDWTHDKLQTAAITRADSQITRSGETRQRFSNEDEIATELKAVLKRFISIGRYIEVVGKGPGNHLELMVYPNDVFRLQKEVSALNVSLWSISDYIESMTTRLTAAQTAVADARTTLRTKMPEIINGLLQDAYMAGHVKGKAAVKDSVIVNTIKLVVDKSAGGATQLSQYVAHATAMGYYHGTIRKVAHDEPLVVIDL